MRRTTITLTDDLAERLDHEARQRHTTVSSVARDLITTGLAARPEGEREIPWAGIIRDEGMPPARDMEEILAREWPDALDGNRR